MTATAAALHLAREAQDLLFRQARTAGTFTDEPVTDEQLRAVHDLVKWAPTSWNTQPLRALVIRGEDARQRLLPYLNENNRPSCRSAPVIVVLAADTGFHSTVARTYPDLPGLAERLAVDPDRAAFATENALLQIGYFIIGVRAAGLAAGPMTGFDPAGVDREFFTGSGWRSLMVLNVGRPGPDAWGRRLPRLDFDEVVRTL